MSAPFVTFDDMIEHLNDVKFGGLGDAQLRVLKRAVRQGYQQLVEFHNWRYFLKEKKFVFNTNVEGSTGVTLTYDHTGGTHERELTLAGDTWPTWMATNPRHARIDIGSEVYEVDRYISTTVVQLSPAVNPEGDIAATTDWTLYRNTYPFPVDFNGTLRFKERNNPWSYAYVEPDEWHTYEQAYGNIGGPFYWTIMQDRQRAGLWVLRTVGYPTDADYISFLYQAKGTLPVTVGTESKASTGTVTGSLDATTLTGSGTSWDSTLEDHVIRISSSTTAPTGIYGSNPFVSESRVQEVTSTTAMKVVEGHQAASSGAAFMVSAHLDVEANAMYSALLRSCEHQLAVMIADAQTIAARQRLFYDAANLAKSNDGKLDMPRQSGQWYGPSRSLLGNVDGYNFGTNQTLPGL